MKTNSLRTKFYEEIKKPVSRGGGLHPHIYHLCHLGIKSGMKDREILDELYKHLRGYRRNELETSLQNAHNEIKTGRTVSYKPKTRIKLRRGRIQEGDMMNLIEESGIRLLNDPDLDAYTMLDILYDDDDYLFIGDIYDKDVLKVSEWKKRDLSKYPFFIPNPMTGREICIGENRDGSLRFSARCDSTVRYGRYAVAEFDDISIEKQCFIYEHLIKVFDVAMLTHSGGKSVHALIRVDCEPYDWDFYIKEMLYEGFLIDLGVDKACKNISRLTRLPGFYREKQQQRILYLCH